MQVKNSVYPNAEQLQGFAEPGPDGPIYMVNLLKFKDHAEYADGRETDLSGQQAYGLYAAGVSKLLRKYGGAPCFSAPVLPYPAKRARTLSASSAKSAISSSMEGRQMSARCQKRRERGGRQLAGGRGRLSRSGFRGAAPGT